MAIRVIDDSKLQDIAVAIQGKDGGGQMTVDEMPGRIDALPSSTPTQKKVNFYTFRNLAFSYKAEEAAALTEMSEAPTIEGFTFQKWNRSLASIKTWLTKHENDNCDLNVGGLYVTTDGHTRIYMHLREAKLASLEMPFCIQRMAGTVVIDWGDGSTPETITAAGVYSHTWQINQYPADVVIDIEYTPSGLTKLVLGREVGSTNLFNNEPYYASCVEKVELGNNIDLFATFKNCTHLREINLPDGVTSLNYYAYAFENCTSLALTVLPDGVTGIGTYAFKGCTSLALTVLPDGVTSIGTYAFKNCTSLYIIDLTAFTNPQLVPTLVNANAFQGIPTQGQFWVANQEMYDAFTTATNWSAYADRFQIKPSG